MNEWLEDCVARSGLRSLSFALRHPETWPADFKWDFADVNGDAAALCHRLWGGPPGWSDIYWTGLLSRLNNISRRDCHRLLFSQAYRVLGLPIWRRPVARVTPALIAERIDRYLADKPEFGWPGPARILRGGEWVWLKHRPDYDRHAKAEAVAAPGNPKRADVAAKARPVAGRTLASGAPR